MGSNDSVEREGILHKNGRLRKSCLGCVALKRDGFTRRLGRYVALEPRGECWRMMWAKEVACYYCCVKFTPWLG